MPLRTTRLWLCACLGLLWLLGSPSAYARGVPADDEPVITAEPAPAWVQPVEPSTTGFAREHAEDGIALEVLDTQVRIRSGERWQYTRGVRRVVNVDGAHNSAQFSFSFSPPHQRLVIHEFTVRRGDTVRSDLDLARVEVLQREPGLEANVYSGRRTAVLVPGDIRPDDVIEYAYSVVGANPVLEGHVMLSEPLRAAIAAGVVAVRVDSDRLLRVRNHIGAPEPTVEHGMRQHTYAWRVVDQRARERIEDTPPGWTSTPWIQLADFDSWEEVATLGARTFAFDGPLPPELADVAANIARQERSDAGRAAAALAHVQNEIRYFSVPLSGSGLRPAEPALTLSRGFGDCKDKSLVLVALLRELGVAADVALVNTEAGPKLPELLPTIGAFDHALVHATIRGESHWLDPTRTGSLARLDELVSSPFRHALVLSETTTDLAQLPGLVLLEREIDTEATYHLAEWDQPVHLHLETRLTGQIAESFRRRVATRSQERLAEWLLDQVRRVHPGAATVGDVEIVTADDGAVVWRGRYLLSDPWTTNDDVLEFAASPIELDDWLPTLSIDREAPLGLTHPTWVAQRTVLNLPEPVQLDREDLTIDEGPLAFSSRSSSTGSVIEIEIELFIQQPVVQPAEFDLLRRDLAAIKDHLPFVVTHDITPTPALTGGTSFNWALFAVAVCWSLVVAVTIGVCHHRSPMLARPDVPWTPHLRGISGWLALLAIGVVLMPFSIAREIGTIVPMLSLESWAAITNPATEGYSPALAPLLLFESMANLALLYWSGYLIWLLFGRHHSFPVVAIGIQLVTLLVLIVDSVAAVLLLGEEELGTAVLVGLGIRTMLWTAYLLRSRRVRSTFLPPPWGVGNPHDAG